LRNFKHLTLLGDFMVQSVVPGVSLLIRNSDNLFGLKDEQIKTVKKVAELVGRGILIFLGLGLLAGSMAQAFPLGALLPIGLMGVAIFGLGCANYPCSQFNDCN
jgi:hypothetical protein